MVVLFFCTSFSSFYFSLIKYSKFGPTNIKQEMLYICPKSTHLLSIQSKEVLMRDRKRRTARGLSGLGVGGPKGYPILPREYLGLVWGVPHVLGFDWGIPPPATNLTGVPPERTWHQRLGYPLPSERTWDQTWDQKPGYPPPHVDRQTDACKNITFP